MKSKISLFWIFYMFNATSIDITTLYYSVFVNHSPRFITPRFSWLVPPF
jgi:hypothetical protein